MGTKEVIVGSLVWILAILFLALPLLIFSTYKVILILIVKCFRRDLVVLSGLDMMQCPGRSHEKSTVSFGFVLRLNSNLNVGELRNLWKQKFLGDDLKGLPGYENLTQCVEVYGGYAFGKKVKITSLEKLIYEKPIDEGKCLEDVVAEWLLTKFTKDFPSWEIIVVPLKATGETAVAFKIHHAFADGYSVLHLLDRITENESPYLVKDSEGNCVQQAMKLIQAPGHMDKMKGDPHLNILECKPVETHRLIVSFTTLDLKTLKRIRRFHKVHLTSVVLSLFGGALRKYSVEKGIVTEDKLPSEFPMGNTVAWPKHPTKVYKSHPQLCNHWATMLLRTSTKDDPVERLLETEKSYVANLECGVTHLGVRCIFPMIGLLPVNLMNKGLEGDMGVSGGYTVTVGGDNYKLLGGDVTHIHNIMAMHDMVPTLPLSIFSFSHTDKMEITFSANPQRFPDREAIDRILKVHLPDELERLRARSELIT